MGTKSNIKWSERKHPFILMEDAQVHETHPDNSDFIFTYVSYTDPLGNTNSILLVQHCSEDTNACTVVAKSLNKWKPEQLGSLVKDYISKWEQKDQLKD